MHKFPFVTLIFAVVVTVSEALPASQLSSGRSKVDFERDVRPLLRKNCEKCHGLTKQEGGLRFDLHSDLSQWGITGDPLPAADLPSNLFFKLLTTPDESIRMPKGKPPLSPAELAVMKEWILAGGPRSIENTKETSSRTTLKGREGESPNSLLIAALWLSEKPYRYCFAILLAGLILAGGISLWLRRRVTHGETLSPLEAFFSRVKVNQVFFLFCVSGLGMGIAHYRDVAGGLAEKVKGLEFHLDSLNATSQSIPTGGSGKSIASDPLVIPSVRLLHPKALTRTYYRGNCERDPKLFNGGNYLTAKLRASLRAADGGEISYGDQLPKEGVLLHFEIERGPGTVEQFYDLKSMSKLALSGDIEQSNKQTTVNLNTIKPDWIWGADYRIIGDNESGSTYLGKVAVLHKGVQHYALHYDLKIENGELSPDSDVWCTCTFVSPKVQPPPAEGQVPLCEWFDWRPLPEIEGENTTDPKLLGLPTNPEEGGK